MLDASIATHTYSQVGKEFDNSTSGYATYNIFQSLAVLILQLVQTQITQFEGFFYYSQVVVSIAAVSIILNYCYTPKTTDT